MLDHIISKTVFLHGSKVLILELRLFLRGRVLWLFWTVSNEPQVGLGYDDEDQPMVPVLKIKFYFRILFVTQAYKFRIIFL